MARTAWIFVLSATFAAAPAAAAQDGSDAAAPPAPPAARYCLRVEPQTGSRIESVECWTRAEWADADVDVDKEWAKEGVRVLA